MKTSSCVKFEQYVPMMDKLAHTKRIILEDSQHERSSIILRIRGQIFFCFLPDWEPMEAAILSDGIDNIDIKYVLTLSECLKIAYKHEIISTTRLIHSSCMSKKNLDIFIEAITDFIDCGEKQNHKFDDMLLEEIEKNTFI